MQQSSKFLVRIRSDFRQFLKHAEKFMMENEAMNNLLWEVGKAIEKKGSKSEVFLTVERNDRVCLAGIISGTGYLILTSGDIEASEELVTAIFEAAKTSNRILADSEVLSIVSDHGALPSTEVDSSNASL